MRNKIWSCTIIIFSAILLLTGCGKNNVLATPQIELPDILPEHPLLGIPFSEQIKEEEEEEEIEEFEEEIEEDTEEVEEEIEEEVITPQKTKVEDEKPFWQSETTLQANNLISIAAAAQTSYIKNGDVKGWFSNNGKLYDYYKKRHVNIDDLVAESYLEAGLNAEDYDLLLIDGKQLSKFPDVIVQEEAMRFGVFAVTKIDENKYLVSSPYGKVGTITEDSYLSLLYSYNANHGEIGRLSSASAEYKRIMNYISLFEGVFVNYFVREIRLDDKYAVVVFSTADNAGDVKQYILRNDNGFWEVVFPDAQNVTHLANNINKYLPDMNLNLLPNYNLSTWMNEITTEQVGVLSALLQIKAINSEKNIHYLCSTKTCAYVVLTNGNAYACYFEDNKWNAEQVDSDRTARNIFKEKTGIDYGFIILDD